MIIIIGGPPRVGKSLIARHLADQLHFSHCSTDDLRWAAKQLDQIPRDDPLFTIDRMEGWKYDRRMYEKYSSQEIIEAQDTESKQVMKLVEGFIDSVSNYGGQNFILEGVASIPSLVSEALVQKYDLRYSCVGNSDFASFAEYSWGHRSQGDWLSQTSKQTFDKVIRYCARYSAQFKGQAQDRDVTYFEIRSRTFAGDIKNAVNAIQATL